MGFRVGWLVGWLVGLLVGQNNNIYRLCRNIFTFAEIMCVFELAKILARNCIFRNRF